MMWKNNTMGDMEHRDVRERRKRIRPKSRYRRSMHGIRQDDVNGSCWSIFLPVTVLQHGHMR